jgi:phosphoribosylformylglycinamidine synthase II
VSERAEESDPAWTLLELLSSPTIASKNWAYHQYDSTVRTSTVTGPGGDAAVVRIRGTNKAIAVKTDCNGRYVYLEPRAGARIAVAEAARNVACTGARPMAITNCLNFGNPRKPDVFFQFSEAVAGMGEACSALGTPVTGGNVSFYNESPTGAVYPTPVVGMVGLIDNMDNATQSSFNSPGDAIILLGTPTNELGASEYLSRIHGITAGRPPACDLAMEKKTIDALLECISNGLLSSAHDCSDGGLAVALAECSMMDRDHQFGASIDLSAFETVGERPLLFGEAQARYVLSARDGEAVLQITARHGIPARQIGTVGTPNGLLEVKTLSRRISVATAELAAAYHDSIARIMSRPASSLAHAAVEVT